MRLTYLFSTLHASAVSTLHLTGMFTGILLPLLLTSAHADDTKTAIKAAPISYYKQVRPLIQAKCQGCHQGGIAGGKYIMTSYADVMKGGGSGVCIVRNKPDASILLEYLTGKRDLMPKGGPPLSNEEMGLFRSWIAQGATDDSPVVKDAIDAAHPPIYLKPPVITALAYSNDGKTLAVSGYREILLHKADGSGLVARLVGPSEKILSLAYSPDGKLLAAVGGSPARSGEIQFWDTATNKPTNTVQMTADTLFGASFSPDSKDLAFGCADNSLRVVSVPDGRQIMRLDNHSDWVFATTFIEDDKRNLHVLSTGRDSAIKLTQVQGASFIDDINTHTSPYRCMARNPKADQVVCAGDDGIPRLYKVFRTAVRTMNQEDHNLLRVFERQPGVATCIAFSPDATMIAVGGESDVVNVYKVADGAKVATLKGHSGVLYALTFSPDSKQLATGGFDGQARLYNLPKGELAKAFTPVPLAIKRASK